MSFSEKSCLVFEQATKAYHITDHIDATVHNPYEVKSIEFYLYLKNWIDAVLSAIRLLSRLKDW